MLLEGAVDLDVMAIAKVVYSIIYYLLLLRPSQLPLDAFVKESRSMRPIHSLTRTVQKLRRAVCSVDAEVPVISEMMSMPQP